MRRTGYLLQIMVSKKSLLLHIIGEDVSSVAELCNACDPKKIRGLKPSEADLPALEIVRAGHET